MSEKLKAAQVWAQWSIADHFPVLQGAPRVVDPETEKLVEVRGAILEYCWAEQRWHFLDCHVDGLEVLEDGTFGVPVECHFYDTSNKTGQDGGPPEWAFALAERRMAQLPPGPPGPDGWKMA